MRRYVLASMAMLIGVVAVVACGGGARDQAVYEPGGPDDGQPQLIHVRGLGVNPADGLPYVATRKPPVHD